MNDKEANEVMDNTLREIDMYKRYSDYYGYVFYIMKKVYNEITNENIYLK